MDPKEGERLKKTHLSVSYNCMWKSHEGLVLTINYQSNIDNSHMTKNIWSAI